MAYEKVSKKAEVTLTNIFLGMIFIGAAFTAFFLFIQSNYESAGVSLPTIYNDTYNEFAEAKNDTTNQINEIRDAAQVITQGDVSSDGIWNGLQGLGAALLLPLSALDLAMETLQLTIKPLAIIPTWILDFIVIALTIILVMAVLGKLSGEQKS